MAGGGFILKYLITGYHNPFSGGDLMRPISVEFSDQEIKSFRDYEKVFENGKKCLKEKGDNYRVGTWGWSVDGIQLWRYRDDAVYNGWVTAKLGGRRRKFSVYSRGVIIDD